MIKELKNNFMQTTFLTSVWVTGLLTIGFGNPTISLNFVWHILAIAGIAGGIFGILYPYVWTYGTWSAPINILVTTLCNFMGGFLAIYLFSTSMFQLVKPYWLAILIITVCLHILAFYFYRNNQNKKIVAVLNETTFSK